MRMCKRCGGIDLTMEYDEENNLTFYCKDCGSFIEKYHGVVPVVEDVVGEGVVVTFNYKDEKMSDFIKRAKGFDRELEALEKKYCVSICAGYSTPGDDENYLMVSDWEDKGKTFIKLDTLDDMEEDDE